MTAEIINPVIKRVDAVDGPATQMGFLILKSDELPVAKADGDELVPDVEGTDVQDGPNVAGTAVDDADAAIAAPGAPAWEAVDAAKARTATAALVQIRDDLKELAARESAEGDDDAWENQFNLSDAACALDFALATLAKFAVDEQNEADSGQQAAEADARALGLIKALHRVHPTEETVTTKTDPIEKAADDALVAVYDQNGNLLGAVSSDALTPLATAPDADSDAATEGDAPADDAAAADAAPAPAPAPEAATAAPAAAPAAPATTEDDPNNVAKSLDDQIAEAVSKVLTAAVEAAVEPLVKSNEELAERLQKMEQTPRNDGPMLNGQRPGGPGPALRGQTRDEAEALRKQLQDESDPGARVAGVANLIRGLHNGL